MPRFFFKMVQLPKISSFLLSRFSVTAANLMKISLKKTLVASFARILILEVKSHGLPLKTKKTSWGLQKKMTLCMEVILWTISKGVLNQRTITKNSWISSRTDSSTTCVEKGGTRLRRKETKFNLIICSLVLHLCLSLKVNTTQSLTRLRKEATHERWPR